MIKDLSEAKQTIIEALSMASIDQREVTIQCTPEAKVTLLGAVQTSEIQQLMQAQQKAIKIEIVELLQFDFSKDSQVLKLALIMGLSELAHLKGSSVEDQLATIMPTAHFALKNNPSFTQTVFKRYFPLDIILSQKEQENFERGTRGWK